MKSVKLISAVVLSILAAVIISATVSRVRAQHITSAYSIWFKQTVSPGNLPQDVLDTLSVEKREAIKNGSSRYLFEGQKENGDSVRTTSLPDGTIHREIKLATKGLDVMTNSKNNTTSTLGTGMPRDVNVVSPDCRQFRGNDADRASDVILGFKTLHITDNSPTTAAEWWIAPALGCATVKMITRRKSDGALNITEAYKATSDAPPRGPVHLARQCNR
jgi:hypothetical protein